MSQNDDHYMLNSVEEVVILDTEIDIASCTDLVDNDLDGFVDCQDQDCQTFNFCLLQENTFEKCSDSTDNDSDGLIDCDDEECAYFTHCMSIDRIEGTIDLCKDGIDNDGQ